MRQVERIGRLVEQGKLGYEDPLAKFLPDFPDPASAKRLGVSTRTYAGYIAALKDEYGVQTRFQLGYAMGADPQGKRPTIEAHPDEDFDGLDQPDADSA